MIVRYKHSSLFNQSINNKGKKVLLTLTPGKSWQDGSKRQHQAGHTFPWTGKARTHQDPGIEWFYQCWGPAQMPLLRPGVNVVKHCFLCQ